jgi:hypothetical protein
VRQPFEASPAELAADLDSYVAAVFESLESSFLVLPRGEGSVEYAQFAEAYESLRRHTAAFHRFTPEAVWSAMLDDGLVFVVIRTILGMSAPEWAYLTSTETEVKVDQGTARSLDQKARFAPRYFASLTETRNRAVLSRVRAMLEVACGHITAGAPPGAADTVHRLDKADTAQGLSSVRRAAELHAPYATMLYERYLGRPFASHRDGVSELVGAVMETAVEHRLRSARVPYRPMARAERVPGFDQAPDFIVPDELAPRAVIEAKLTNDDGTARDKVTRIIHLVELSRARVAAGQPGFEVIACIDGRGFGVRREDMRRLLLAVNGKVFTLRTMDQLVSHTVLAEYAVAPEPAG